MRSALIAAAFVAGALAVPYQNEKRVLVTDTAVDIVYVTDITTVTVNGPAPTAQAKNGLRHGHFWHHTSAGTTTTAAPAMPTWTTSSSEEPAAPSPTSSPASQAPASTASTVSSATGGSGAVPSTYAEIVVLAHNLHRKNHSASDVAWDDGLASSAATIAASCVYAHNVEVDGGGYGQNIAAGVPGSNVSAVITDLFYNGEVNNFNGLYGEANPSMANFENWGHFSQIVWKATTLVACATQDCSSGGLANVGSDVSPYFTVCNYKSAGNFAGEYGVNIGEPLGEPTANWNTGL